MKHTWSKVKWPYNDAEPYASWVCWQFRQVLLHQLPHDGEWGYVAMFGHNSERSHSGAFPPGFTLEQAKEATEARYREGKF